MTIGSDKTDTVQYRPDDNRMLLTQDELEWAWEIRDTVEGVQGLDNLSDFWYAQLALVNERGDIESVMETLYRLQLFREEYKVAETLEESNQDLIRMVEMFPGHALSFSITRAEGNPGGDYFYSYVYDMKGWNLKALSSNEKVERFVRMVYYFMNAINPDLAGIRIGVCYVAECEGFGWENMSINIYKRLLQDIGGVYPQNIVALKYYHTGFFTNVLYSMVKRILPAKITEKMTFGQFHDVRLDKIFMVPNADAAKRRFIARMIETNRKRFHNVTNYSLPPKPVNADTGPRDDISGILERDVEGHLIEDPDA